MREKKGLFLSFTSLPFMFPAPFYNIQGCGMYSVHPGGPSLYFLEEGNIKNNGRNQLLL